MDFAHPGSGVDAEALPVYVFGPEDGTLPGAVVKRCHRFVVLPSYECLNLANSVAALLYDRMAKMPAGQRPQVRDRSPKPRRARG